MNLQVDSMGRNSTSAEKRPKPVRYQKPSVTPTGPIVSCPHSGQYYPPELLALAQVDRLTLRRTEDAFVDQLFADGPSLGADLIVNEFARAYVDVNRSADELDPRLFFGLSGNDDREVSPRVQAGLGVIPRSLGDDIDIYSHKLDILLAEERLNEVHRPWHLFVKELLDRRRGRGNRVLLLDCHSMPSHSSGDPSADIILGDRFGSSCAPILMSEAVRLLREAGLRVARNDPYPGGYTTAKYGQPFSGCHALQIEINRSLYMVEGAMTKRPQFNGVRDVLTSFMRGLTKILPLI